MKRRSFFLLEVLIAVLLIGSFAYLSMRGFFTVIGKQRKLVKELKDSMTSDLKRTDLVVKYWNAVTKNNKDKEDGYTVELVEGEKDKYYLLKLKKSEEEYCYFIDKTRI